MAAMELLLVVSVAKKHCKRISFQLSMRRELKKAPRTVVMAYKPKAKA